MSHIPVKSRIPPQVWIVAGLLTLVSALSSLVEAADGSVAPTVAQPLENPPSLIKSSILGDRHPSVESGS